MNWKRVLSDEAADNAKLSVTDEQGNNLLPDEDEVNSLVVDKESLTDDEDFSEEDVVIERSDKTTASTSAEKENTDELDKETKNTEAKETKQKNSRAQDRIRELIRKNKEAEARYQEEIKALRQELQSSSKSSVETQKDFIDARITDIKKSLTKAQEEGKFDEAVELMSDLSQLQTKKTVVDAQVAKMKEEGSSTEGAAKERQANTSFDDTYLLSWVATNSDWWQKDQAKTTLAVRLSKKIDQEGLYRPDEAEYWEELDERLEQLLNNRKRSTSQEDESEDMSKNLQSSSKKEANSTKKPPQTTAGASRTSATGNKSNAAVIKLSREEREMARKLGISDLDWAKQKFRQQRNTDENGYQIVFGDN